MAWAIISDIHGNLQALEAVLEEMGEVDGILCLGDVVGYGADPEECCGRIKELEPLALLKGNHEAGVLGELPLSWFGRPALLALTWTRAVLSQEALDLLSTSSLQATPGGAMASSKQGSLESSPALPWGNPLLFHGAISDPFDYLDSTWKADQVFHETQSGLCFFGHTHIAGWFELPEAAKSDCPSRPERSRRRPFGTISRVETARGGCLWSPIPRGGLLKLEKEERYVVNCGSVGQPRDGNPQAAFGLFDPAAGTVEFRRVGYRVSEAQKRIKRAGLPGILADRLSVGL